MRSATLGIATLFGWARRESRQRRQLREDAMTRIEATLDETLVQQRAFELWQARGCPIGSPEDDWFRAKLAIEADRAVENGVPEPVASAPEAEARFDLPMGLCIRADEIEHAAEPTAPRASPTTRVQTPRGAGVATVTAVKSQRRRRSKSDRI
jgi:hypothetical protein